MLIIVQDMSDVLWSKGTTESGNAPDHTHNHTSSTEQLERKVGLATCPSEVLTAVDDLWNALPASQQPALVVKVGII